MRNKEISFKALNKPQRLSDEISQQIAEKITSGQLLPGTQLPTESELGKEFGVSRTAIREAIAKLRQDGLVFSHQGRGLFVADDLSLRAFQIDADKLKTVEDLRSVMELRIEMEVGGAAMAARRRTHSQLAKMKKILEQMKKAVIHREDFTLLEQDFYKTTAEAAHNKYYQDFVQFLASRVNASHVLEKEFSHSDKRISTQKIREHEKLFSAIEIGDPDKARRAAWWHVLRSADRIGLRGLQGWEESRMTLVGDNYTPVCATADPNTKKPDLTLPPKACDCHAHIIGPQSRYPFTPHRSYTPPDALLASYKEMLAILGIERAVIVQPSVYGTDNRATLDAIKQGGNNFRGVVVLDENISVSEMERMHDLGVRGVRINLLFKSGIEVSDVRKLARKIAPFDWHLQMLVDVSEFSELDTLEKLPVQVVFDHMGHMPTSTGVNHPGFKKMLQMIEKQKAWAKISGPYRITCQKNLPYEDCAPFAKKIVETNPERVVWATDWPHPYINVPMPNDGDLLNLLAEWVPDTATREKILVRNPAKLYDFQD